MLNMIKGIFKREDKEGYIVEENYDNLLDNDRVVIEEKTFQREENLNDLMTELNKWRHKFIGRKKELNNYLLKLDKEEYELNYLKRKATSDCEVGEIEEKIAIILSQKEEIVKEKNLIRLIDLDNEFSYDMIGMKINNYRYYSKQQTQA